MRIVLLGDSRVFGFGEPAAAHRLGRPGPTATYGTAYTVLPTSVTLVGGSGTGATLAYKISPSGGLLAITPKDDGAGYTTGNMPTIQVTGGDGTPPDYGWGNGPAGGYSDRLQTYLQANGFAAAEILNQGISGASISGAAITGPSALLYQCAEAGIVDKTSGIIVFDYGINDGAQGKTAQQYHDGLNTVVTALVNDGYKIIIDDPYGVPGADSGTNHQNALVLSYAGQNAAIVSAFNTSNPGMVFKGATPDPTMSSHPEYYADGLHPNAAGNVYLAQVKGAAYVSVLNTLNPAAPASSGAYDSAPSNEVAVTPGYVPLAPVITTFSGLSIYPNARVVLGWSAGNWGDIEVERLTVGAAGAAGVYAVISTLTEVTPGDRTSVPITFTDTNVVFGVAYKYRLVAQGTA